MAMRGILVAVACAVMMGGCGSGDVEGDAYPDVAFDTHEDEPLPECVAQEDCDDSDPCTRDICDLTTGECHNLLFDRDGDGHTASMMDGVACPGDDCDDLHAFVHPGAEEICLDGVDQDCDGAIDGPMLMIESSTISTVESAISSYWANVDLAWTGREYGIAWTWFWSNIGCALWFCWNEVWFARIGADGTGLADAVLVKNGPNSLEVFMPGPALVWADGEFDIFSQFGGSIWLSRLSERGTALSASVALSDTLWRSGPVWTGSQFRAPDMR